MLSAFRVLAGGDELEAAGADFLERACAALGAVEGALLLAGTDPNDPLAGHHRGTPGPEGSWAAAPATAAGTPP